MRANHSASAPGSPDKSLKHGVFYETPMVGACEKENYCGGENQQQCDFDPNARVYLQYIQQKDNSGVTIMWHGIPSRCTAENDLLPLLKKIAVDHLKYLYLPMNHHSKSHGMRSTKVRNKGYAFLHFGDVAAAADFAARVDGGLSVSRKRTSTTLAVYQGISANLKQLLEAPESRTAHSVVYVRQGGRMDRICLRALASHPLTCEAMLR
jgi:hypothetical protein